MVYGVKSYAETSIDIPIKQISSCTIDLNADNKSDIALLFETDKGQELVVLMKTVDSYNVFIVSKGMTNMYLSCYRGKSVKETAAGKGQRKGKTYKTPGAYLKLTQPEGSSVVFFWNRNEFREVWTAD